MLRCNGANVGFGEGNSMCTASAIGGIVKLRDRVDNLFALFNLALFWRFLDWGFIEFTVDWSCWLQLCERGSYNRCELNF